jgi:hypothetical protein
MTVWVDEDHPEINLTGKNTALDLMEQLEALLYEDDYIRIEDITVKEDS